MPCAGDFGLLTGRSPVDDLIRLGELLNGNGFSKYSHAFVLLDDDTIVESMPGGARISPVTEYPADLVTWSSWDLTDAERARIVTVARATEGIGYSFLDYGALAARRLHIPAPGLRAYIAATGHRICSQNADQIYHDAGQIMFADGRWAGDVVPADLALVLTGPKGR